MSFRYCDWLTLELGFVLDNQGVVLVADGLGELGGDGVVSCLVLEHKTLVSLNRVELLWLFHRPGTNILPFFLSALLLRMRHLPPGLPVVGELLKEGSLQGNGLERSLAWPGSCVLRALLTVKLGLTMGVEATAEETAEAPAEPTEEAEAEASDMALSTSSGARPWSP